MALVLADRVLETTQVTGTGDALLGGAQANYQPFSVIGNTSTTYYTIVDNTNNSWEVGIGTYVLAGNKITRDTVLSSSNGGALVYFASGTKDIFLDLPSEKVLLTAGDVTGPASAINNNFAAFNLTTGKLIKDSGYNASTFATAAQGAKADTAVQPGSLGSAAYLNAGAANGVATLDAGGKVPVSQIPALGDLNYQGTWNATTNVPTLVSSAGTKGYYYVVATAGTTNLNGITDWQIGDWAVFNGSVWQKIDNTDAVTSVNGYTGTVVLTASDVGAQPAGTYVTSVGATSPVTSSGGTTPTIAMPAATTSVSGYLTSTDWTTFNSKAPATSGTSILYGDGLGGFSNVTIGTGVSFAGGTLSATGSGGTVTAVTGSGNIASTGGTTPNITFTGTLPIANGGTNTTATPILGGVTYGTGTAQAYTSTGSSGQFLTSSGAGTPTWTSASALTGAVGYYGAYHDQSTVTATSTTTAYVMNIGTVDLQNGTSIVAGTQLTVANAGVYNMQFSAQFSNPNAAIADISVWLRLNGVNISASTGTNGVPAKHGGNNGLQIVSWNYVLTLAAGDYLELIWHSDATGVQLITFPATTSPVTPESPALIVTIQAVTQIGIGYYGQTSLTSTLIGTGSKTFTMGIPNTASAFTVGTRVRFAYTTTPANFMEGVITSFASTTMVVNVDLIGGSGTYATWAVSVAGSAGSGVSSFAGNSTGLTPTAATSGAITLGGTLVASNGGTGLAGTLTGISYMNGTGAHTVATTAQALSLIGTLPIANGGTNATTAPAAGANIFGFTTTATATGTTTLTNTSTIFQLFTGTLGQIIVLPVASTLTQGWTFNIVNNSTNSLTVNSSGGNLVTTIVTNASATITCILASGTTAASWTLSGSTTAVWGS